MTPALYQFIAVLGGMIAYNVAKLLGVHVFFAGVALGVLLTRIIMHYGVLT